MKEIKIFEGIKIVYKGEEQICSSFPEIWEIFNWDIKNNPQADECAKNIVRELLMFLDCDLKDVNGNIIHLEIIPCKN